VIQLPAPQKTGGKPLFEALMERVSTKEFTEKEVPLQELSNVLWSAYGFNREDKRVIPTSSNFQHLSVYVFFKDSVYLYDAKENKLLKKADGDHRRKIGRQDFVYVAPVNLLYVADGTKEAGTGSHISIGSAAQNVYLVCASQGLACVVRTGFDAEAVRELLKLPATDELIAAQTVGYAPAPLPITGTITMEGKPVEGAVVQFISSEGDGTTRTATTGVGGRYSLQNSGVLPPGEYHVALANLTQNLANTSTVTGTITFDGTPLDAATVKFIPNVGNGTPYTALTDDKGRYSFQGNSGMMPGEYRVTVSKVSTNAGVPQEMLPKYASPETSPLMLIVGSGRNVFQVEVSK
jgi:nitroreductase